MSNVIITTEEALKKVCRNVAIEALNEFKTNQEIKNVYYINQVAKILKKHPATIKKYVKEGKIKTNKAGLITHEALTEFLKAK